MQHNNDNKVIIAHRKYRGSALIMVIILLTVGSLIIPPWLQFTQTALRASRISSNQLALEMSANAGIRQAIWRLQTNDSGFADLLSLENPSASYSVPINGMEVMIDVDIPDVPDSPPAPPQESGPHLYIGKGRSVKWIKYQEYKVFTYTIDTTNYGTSVMHLGEIGDAIPPPFRYVPGSSHGMTNEDPTITMDQNRQVLTWIMSTPLPKLNAGETRTQTFEVIHETGLSGRAGVHYNEGWAVDYPKSVGKIPSGPAAPVAISVYKIRARVQATSVVAQVAISDTDSTILSWQ